jgi:hypothetical protein
MAVNAKNKGNTFERKIANLLSTTFAQHTGLISSFRRNVDSGSFFGGSNFKRTETHDTEKATYGDIIAPSAFKFNIECKHYKEAPSFSSILKQEYATFDKWIEQAELDSKSSGKIVMIIMKFNNVPESVMVPSGTLSPDLCSMKYKNYEIGLLDNVLKLPVAFFFE